MHTTPGHVVNGGLIDFQDNFYRGAPDYSGYMNAQHGMGAGGGGMQSFPGPAAFHAMQQQHASFPGVLAAGMPGMQPATPFPCISGPPAYFHINGQTYVPADAQQPMAVAGKPAAAPAVATPVPAEPAPRVLTEEEIERRVRNRVEEWAAGQRKPVYCAGTPAPSKRGRGRDVSDEDRAVDRIKSVNASMRDRFVSPF